MAVPILSSFNAGELSPLLDARTDLAKYGNGCRALENFLILPQGGAERRPGTQYMGATKQQDRAPRLIPFVFSEGESAILEFGDFYMRVWRDGGQVTDEFGDVYELATPFSIDDAWSFNHVQSADVIYIACRSLHPQKLQRHDWADWEIGEIDFDYRAFLDENVDDITVYAKFDGFVNQEEEYLLGDCCVSAIDGKTYRCILAYTTATPPATSPDPSADATHWELAEDNYAGSKPVTLVASDDIFEPEHVGGYWLLRHPRKDNTIDDKLTATGLPKSTDGIPVFGTWTLVTGGLWQGTIVVERSYDNGVTWQRYRVYNANKDRNIDTDGEEEIPNALYRITREDDPDGNSGSVNINFTVRDYYIDGIVLVTEYISATEVRGTIIDKIASVGEDEGKTGVWAEGAWSERNGYPSCVTIFEERLVFAGTAREPQKMWFSSSTNYELLKPGDIDTAAMSYTIASDRVDAIRWIVAKDVLLVGTTGGEYRFGASKIQDALTPTNVSCRRQTTHGSGSVHAIMVNDAALFWMEHNKTLREMTYSFEKDAFVAPNLTIMAEHITGQDGVTQMAFQRHPYSILWCVRKDGQLACLTYNREEDVVGWSRMTTQGMFESVAAIPGEAEDEIWCVVAREVDGETVRYMERFAPRDFDKDLLKAKFLDCHLSSDIILDAELVEIYNNWAQDTDGADKAVAEFDRASHAYVAGDGCTDPNDKDRTYICILGYTTNGSSPDPHSDPTHWETAKQYVRGMIPEYLFVNGDVEEYLKCGIEIVGGSRCITFRHRKSWVLCGKVIIEGVDLNNFLEIVKISGEPVMSGVIYVPYDMYKIPLGHEWFLHRYRMAAKLDKPFNDGIIAKLVNFLSATELEGKTFRLRSSGRSNIAQIERISNLEDDFLDGRDFPEFDRTWSYTSETTTVNKYNDPYLDQEYQLRGLLAYTFDDAGARGKDYKAYDGVDRTLLYGQYPTGVRNEGLQFLSPNFSRIDESQVSGIVPHATDDYTISFHMKVVNTTLHGKNYQTPFQFSDAVTGDKFIVQWRRSSDAAFKMWVQMVNKTTKYYFYAGTTRNIPSDGAFHNYQIRVRFAGGKMQFGLIRDGTEKKYNTTIKSWDNTVSYNRLWLAQVPAYDEEDYILDEITFFRSYLDWPNNLDSEYLTSASVTRYAETWPAYTMGGEMANPSYRFITGLGHLEGMEIEAVVDGACHPAMTVEDGAVTLNDGYEHVVVGLRYDSTLTTMRIEGEVGDGGSHPREKRITEVNIRFKDTVNGKIISPENNEETVYFRNSSDDMSEHLPLFTGDKRVYYPTGFRKDMTITVRQESPMPMTVLLMAPKMGVFE